MTCASCQLPTGTGDHSEAVGFPLHRMGTPHGAFISTGKTSPGLLVIGWSDSISGRLGTVRTWGTVPVQLQPVFESKWPKLAQIPRRLRGLFDLFPLLGNSGPEYTMQQEHPWGCRDMEGPGVKGYMQSGAVGSPEMLLQ